MTDKTRDEVNRYLHERMGKCWHVFNYGPDSQGYCCKRADDFNGDPELLKENPDYCSDWSPRSLLNEVVAMTVEQVGKFELGEILVETLLNEGGLHYNPNIDNSHAVDLITATNEQIARACCEALEAGDGK